MTMHGPRLTLTLAIAVAQAACHSPAAALQPDGQPPDGQQSDVRVTVLPPYPHNCAPPIPDSGTSSSGEALFERIAVPGLTDVYENTAGSAFVDLDGDGLVDAFLVRDDVHAYLNRGCFSFASHELAIDAPTQAPGHLDAPSFADFNHDGFLEVYVGSDGAHNQARLCSRSSRVQLFPRHVRCNFWPLATETINPTPS
jgi:hypothetical protein